MSYSIIRNEKYNRSSLIGLYRHNERKNTCYTNKNINHEKTLSNYSLKKCNTTYLQKFEQLRQEHNLQGWIKKNSNVVCEYIITSDEEFFETAYEFVKNYKQLGEEYIISATVHLDEATPHMHLIYIPVVHTIDKKTKENVDKICCSDFWKGKDSYKFLQDNFHKYMVRSGFDLERGDTKDNEHIKIEDLKKITNYEMQEMFKDTSQLETELVTNNFQELQTDYKRVIKKFNTLAKQYTRVKNITDNILVNQEKLEQQNQELKDENNYLENENNRLNNFLEKTYEYVSILFNFPKDRLKRLVKDFVDKMKGN